MTRKARVVEELRLYVLYSIIVVLFVNYSKVFGRLMMYCRLLDTDMDKADKRRSRIPLARRQVLFITVYKTPESKGIWESCQDVQIFRLGRRCKGCMKSVVGETPIKIPEINCHVEVFMLSVIHWSRVGGVHSGLRWQMRKMFWWVVGLDMIYGVMTKLGLKNRELNDPMTSASSQIFRAARQSVKRRVMEQCACQRTSGCSGECLNVIQFWTSLIVVLSEPLDTQTFTNIWPATMNMEPLHDEGLQGCCR